MKLIIDIPEDLYKEKILGTTSNRQDRKILECVKNGTPLEELEKIKAEIQGLCHTERDTFDKVVRLDKLNNAIDNHISELKGE